MRSPSATGTGTSTHSAHLYGKCAAAVVRFEERGLWLGTGRGDMGGMRVMSGVSAEEFRTLDFPGT